MAMLDLAAAASQAWLPMLVGTYTDTDSKGIYQYRFNQESGTAELTAVTPAPSNTALNRLLVSFSRIFSILPPDALDKPSPSIDIPYRKNARPPKKAIAENISIS